MNCSKFNSLNSTIVLLEFVLFIKFQKNQNQLTCYKYYQIAHKNQVI